MVCFMFTEYFIVANMALGQFKAHGHEYESLCLIFHIPYLPNLSFAGSYAFPKASDPQEGKGSDCNIYAGNKTHVRSI